MKIQNCTPHKLNLMINGEWKEIEPSGVTPRLSTIRIELGGYPFCAYEEGYGDVTDLPERQPDTILVVSRVVAENVRRDDLFFPTDYIREEGVIVGAAGLARPLR